MAYRGTFIVPKQSVGIPTFDTAGGSNTPFPFKVTNTEEDKVIVEDYSYLLEDMDIKTKVPICGINYAFKLEYGEKIYLETVYDINGQVAYARIDNEASWLIQTNSTSASGDNDSGGELVYPSLIAVLSKTDAEFYSDYLTDQMTRLQSQKNEDLQYWQDQMDAAQQEQDTDTFDADKKIYDEHAKNYDNAIAKLTSMSDGTAQKNFFSNVTSIRKQVSSYNLIAYTTKNPAAATDLNAVTITPPKPSGDDSGDDGGDSDDFMQAPEFFMVQTLNKDLMLMDIDFKRTACRYPMEFSRPVYYFLDPDTEKAEDDEQVDDNTDNDSS